MKIPKVLGLILFLILGASCTSKNQRKIQSTEDSGNFMKMCKDKRAPKAIKKTIGYLKLMVTKPQHDPEKVEDSRYPEITYEFTDFGFAPKEMGHPMLIEDFLIDQFNRTNVSCERVYRKLMSLDSLRISTMAPIKYGVSGKDRSQWTIKGITDISPIAEFTHFKYLHLGQNSIRSLEPLKNMHHLEVLKLGKNDISDISPLAELKDLKVLEIFTNIVEDITPLAGLTNLVYLDLFDNYLGSRDKFTKMKRKARKAQERANLETLNNFTKLRHLGFSSNFLQKIHYYNNAPNLEYLNLSTNFLRNLKGIDNFKKVKTLSVKNNYLNNVKGIENLKLGTLKLSGDRNLISCWAPLKNQTFAKNETSKFTINLKMDKEVMGKKYTCIQCKGFNYKSELIRHYCRNAGDFSQKWCFDVPVANCVDDRCDDYCKKTHGYNRVKRANCQKLCKRQKRNPRSKDLRKASWRKPRVRKFDFVYEECGAEMPVCK